MTKLEDNPTSCMTALTDTDDMFEQMLTFSSNSLISLLNSYQVLIMDNNSRVKLYNICDNNKVVSILFLCLLGRCTTRYFLNTL
jgi:hypothetical protein